jgi:hypothetical protein
MTRNRPLTIAALLCLSLVAADFQPPRDAPPMTVSEIPLPPQQKRAWKAPESALPETLVTAATILFDQGLADPRGCEYRQVEIGVGDVWGRSNVTRTRAWVLPAPAGAKQQFGVAWNGLVYPLVSVGKVTSVRDDILALLRADEELRATAAKQNPKFPFSRPTAYAIDEGASLSETAMSPIKVCLLLRAGETELAQKYWDAYIAGMPPRTDNNDKNRADPYLMLASDWAWSFFDRALCAHMRGDDKLALATCRALEPVGALIDATAAQRSFTERVDGAIKRPSASFVGFLQSLPRLREDQERRAREAAGAAAHPAPPPPADAAARVAALIHDLQEVSVRQDGQPGGVSLADSPTVAALVKEGQPAVEPLFACIESDRRLTRSVSFHRDFFRDRRLHGVDEAAYAAVTQILEIRSFAGGRKASLADLRAVWEKTKGKPAWTRWRAALADDAATADQWLEAAARIVQPVDVEMHGGWTSIPQRKPGEIPAMRGEALRRGKNPSVAELMARRTEMLARSGRPGSEQTFNLQKASNMALHLAEWDPAAAVPVLQAQFARCQAYIANDPLHGSAARILGRSMAQLTLAAHRAGDAAAPGNYAKWLTPLKPDAVSDYLDNVLEPLWRYPDDPAMVKAAQAMFGDTKSPWRDLLAPGSRIGRGGPSKLLGSPMIGLAPVRALVGEMLNDQTEIGTASVHDGQLSINITNGGQMGIGLRNAADPLALSAPESFPIRACDMLAANLSWIDGMPLFEVYWPRERRDQAIARITAFLDRYGERYKYSQQQQQLWRWPDENVATMTFPALDHVATADEARDGRAVFSLADQKGEVREYKLDRLPLKAKWITFKEFPREVKYFPVDGRPAFTTTEYEQDGRVWQAEELRATATGEWQRYYGFVGSHTIARVPADQIDFPEDWYRWGALSGRFDLQVEPPGVSYQSPIVRSEPASLNGRLNVNVRIRNRSGVEQQAPTEFYRGGATPAFASGLRIELNYAPPLVGDRKTRTINWEKIPPRPVASLATGPGHKTLGPTEQFDAFTFDLRDLFDVNRPGRYQIIIRADKESGLGEGRSNEVVFTLVER